MKLPPELAQQLAEYPLKLRNLIAAELAAGNTIAEIGGGFPAPPVGGWVRLAGPVTTRPRKPGRGLDFYERNTSSYSGEFTDEKRFFFVLEAPLPPPPPPDMDAIRAELEARQRAADAERFPDIAHLLSARTSGGATPPARRRSTRRPRSGSGRDDTPAASTDAAATPEPPAPPRKASAYERFRKSMEIDYNMWREGIGYDLEILRTASPEELVELEQLLVNRPVEDWRDVEALAVLDSPRARVLLQQARNSGKQEIALAVLRHAPKLVSEADRTAMLLTALEKAESFGGLSGTLAEIEEFHPPVIMDALFRALLTRDGATAVNLAGLVDYLHGKSASAFDWDHRPFYLRFHTSDPAEREQVFRDFCQRVGVSPEKYLTGK